MVEIRKAIERDIPALKKLYSETIYEVCKKDYNPEQLEVWNSSVENASRWSNALRDQFFIVANIQDRIVGFGSLKEGSYIDFLYVSRHHQRKGVAKKIYDALAIASQKYESNILESDVSITAKPFFEKMGFKVVHENKNIKKGVELINFRMLLQPKT